MVKRDKAAIRAKLTASDGIDFTASGLVMSHSQRVAVANEAKRCGYRKSISSRLTMAGAFFEYLKKSTPTS